MHDLLPNVLLTVCWQCTIHCLLLACSDASDVAEYSTYSGAHLATANNLGCIEDGGRGLSNGVAQWTHKGVKAVLADVMRKFV